MPSSWTGLPDAVPACLRATHRQAPLSCAVVDAGKRGGNFTLAAHRDLDSTLDRLSRRLARVRPAQRLQALRASAGAVRTQAPCQAAPCYPDGVVASLTIRGRGLVQHRLTPVLRCLFVWPPQKSPKAALLWRPAPPSPQRGALTRPSLRALRVNIMRGIMRTGPVPRSLVPRSAAQAQSPAFGPHNPHYVSMAAAANSAALRRL